MTVGRLFGGSLVERIGRVATLRVTGVLVALGVTVVVWSPGLPGAMAGAVLWGVGASLGFPLGMSAAGDDRPAGRRPRLRRELDRLRARSWADPRSWACSPTRSASARRWSSRPWPGSPAPLSRGDGAATPAGPGRRAAALTWAWLRSAHAPSRPRPP